MPKILHYNLPTTNGRNSKDSLIDSIQTYIDKNSKKFGGDSISPQKYIIGCIILRNCQFWEVDNYIELATYNISFPNQVVTWKAFDVIDPFTQPTVEKFELVSGNRIPMPSITNSRKGQNKFKGELLKAYNNKCCISGNEIPELLEAAHIQSYRNENSNSVQNGLLMRVDLHRLYDNRLISIDENYRVQVSPLAKEYEQYDGIKITLPSKIVNHPSKDALKLNISEYRG